MRYETMDENINTKKPYHINTHLFPPTCAIVLFTLMAYSDTNTDDNTPKIEPFTLNVLIRNSYNRAELHIWITMVIRIYR